MSMTGPSVPGPMPVLSRGKHRNPRRGACFMEFASYLAGERWSDHPSCTHPLLAAVARGVNDAMSDQGRSRLAPLIPSVIGLVSDDPRVDVHIALRCARTALPLVSMERQRVMAVSILACERVLAEHEGRPVEPLRQSSAQALARVPAATRWALRFSDQITASVRGFHRHGAPSIVSSAIGDIAQAGAAGTDDVLHGLLVGAIDDCRRFTASPGSDDGAVPTLDAETAAHLRRLTGAAGS